MLSHPVGANDAAILVVAREVFRDDINWYFPHYIPSTSSQKLMLGHFASRLKDHLN